MSRPPLIILFDGVCNLCNASVHWIIRRDRHDACRFAPLQSPQARAALAQARVSPDTFAALDTMVVIDGTRVLTHSDAALAIASRLSPPWKWGTVARLLPRTLRDAIYNLIARNRYRWFGRQSACMVPTPALQAKFQAKFLDAPP